MIRQQYCRRLPQHASDKRCTQRRSTHDGYQDIQKGRRYSMIIHGERVKLRPIAPADVKQLIIWSQDPEVSRFLEGDYPDDFQEAEAWYRKIKSDRQNKRWAILTKDDRLIGDVELDHIAWRSREAEMRICIGDRRFWNKGYGTDVVLTVCRHAFNDLSLNEIYLRVFTENVRAIRCYEKAGFVKEGRIRRPDPYGNVREVLLMRQTRRAFEKRYQRAAKDNNLSA